MTLKKMPFSMMVRSMTILKKMNLRNRIVRTLAITFLRR